MKTLERRVFAHIRLMVSDYMDPLQFAYQPNNGVDDALIYMHTIQPGLLGEKRRTMELESGLVSWVLDYLTQRPQYDHCYDPGSKGSNTMSHMASRQSF